MRRIAILISACLILSPAFAADGKVKEDVSYLGQGLFGFGKKIYAYDDLVAALHAAHPDESIDLISVDMGKTASQLDKSRVCQLRQALQTRVKLHLVVGDEKRELFCN